ncbi:MAG: hypothetical protein ACRBCI_00380 [Cellvibrionaceae bacterium]
MVKNYVATYLKKYAEPTAKTINMQFPRNCTFNHCLIIPAYNETQGFITRLIEKTPLLSGNLLVILIINQPDNTVEKQANKNLWKAVQVTGIKVDSNHNHHLIQSEKNKAIYFLAINCFEGKNKLPRKNGVGLARKIGCDIACRLAQNKIVKTEWIHTTDADAHLPEDYFLQTSNNKDYSAAVYNYQHHGLDTPLTQATLLYEKALHYYVEGLSYANSPYAFHTLGSCIAINITYYAKARGFPKKAGGEDFYLLNKLAKLGKIKTLNGDAIILESRESDRVPFGTGPAVKKIAALKTPQTDYHYYNPLIFEELKSVLSHFPLLFDAIPEPQQWIQQLSNSTQTALSEINIQDLFDHLCKQVKTKEQCIKDSHDWMDGFKTLKFIHALRKILPDIPLNDAITSAKFP